jgi:hypothetical protein
MQLRRAHADDRAAVKQGIRDIYERHHVNPATGLLAPLVPMLLVDLSVVFSPLHQTVYEQLVGTRRRGLAAPPMTVAQRISRTAWCAECAVGTR